MKKYLSVLLVLIIQISSLPITVSAEKSFIFYGNYPQTQIKDDELITELNAVPGDWQSCNYYSGEGAEADSDASPGDFMKFRDVYYKGRKYRGMYLTDYRPVCTGYPANADMSRQDENGYLLNTAYWFEFEPLKWRILDRQNRIIMCEKIIDTQPYTNRIVRHDDMYYNSDPPSTYANNYYYSSIREMLNNDFYDTAFTDNQKENILNSYIDNNAFSAEFEIFNSQPGSDKIYLLSMDEVCEPSYGFNADRTECDAARTAFATDYAAVQGLWLTDETGGNISGNWWLRTAGNQSSCSCMVVSDGQCYVNYLANGNSGIRPVCKLDDLTSDTSLFSYKEEYAELYAAIAIANSINRNYYTNESISALDDAVNAVNLDNEDLSQEQLDVWTDSINTALSDLQYKGANYSEIEKYENLMRKLDSSLYEAQWLAAVNEAFAAVPQDAKVTEQDSVDHAADVIANAIFGLRLKSDFKHIEYGNYPQSRVYDEQLINKLNDTDTEWISFNYFNGSGSNTDGSMESSDFMRYRDVTYEGKKYRGVIFDEYRPITTGYLSSEDKSEQDNNGYYVGNIYWFVFEPLSWKVLDDNSGLVLCDTIIDSQAYNSFVLLQGEEYYGSVEAEKYANSYYNSSIRQWLNDDFYNTAFTNTQKVNIKRTELDNRSAVMSLSSYRYENNSMNSSSSSDKVFLLSISESTNENYGFSENTNAESDPGRWVKASDYAKCQGVYVPTEGKPYYSPYYEKVGWWLRTPAKYSFGGLGESVSQHVCSWFHTGKQQLMNVYNTNRGVRPAMSLSAIVSDTSIDSETNLSALIDALESAAAVDREIYTTESLNKLDEAIIAASAADTSSPQDTVDELTEALNKAIFGLEYKPADYSAVNDALDRAATVDRVLFTDESLADLDSALASVPIQADIRNQSGVNYAAEAILAAIAGLKYKPADYTGVDDAIAQATLIDREYYSQATLTMLDQSIAAVERGLPITQQADVDSFAEEIFEAINGLKYADITLRNEPNGVIVSATTKEIRPRTALTVDMLDPSQYETANFAVGGSIKSVKYYDINLIRNSSKVQPEGEVTVKIKIPDGVNPEKCRVYHVTDDPVDPLVRFSNTLDGGYIIFKTEHFSEFAIIEVETVLNGIEITKPPAKTVYNAGEHFDPSGMEITATFSDGTEIIVTDFNYSVEMTTAGTKMLTVYYTFNGTTKSAEWIVTVLSSAAEPIFIKMRLPKTDKLRLGDILILYVDVSKLPEGAVIVWTANGNVQLSPENNGRSCRVKCMGKGNATITATVVDNEGNALQTASGAKASVNTKLTLKAGLFARIISFFKNLFRVDRVINR